jgi:hypothetical protein
LCRSNLLPILIQNLNLNLNWNLIQKS